MFIPGYFRRTKGGSILKISIVTVEEFYREAGEVELIFTSSNDF